MWHSLDQSSSAQKRTISALFRLVRLLLKYIERYGGLILVAFSLFTERMETDRKEFNIRLM